MYDDLVTLVRQRAGERRSPSTDAVKVWRERLASIGQASTIWVVQLSTSWLTDTDWASTRDDIDTEVFRAAFLRGEEITCRRMLLFSPPSDLGGSADSYRTAKESHLAWIDRIRRQLAVLGAEGSAGRSESSHVDYRVQQLLLPRVGTKATVPLDGMWLDEAPPAEVLAAWNGEGPIPMDPHEENIVGPFGDRNPLWAGTVE